MEEWKLQRIKEALYPTSVAVLGVSAAANNLGTQVVDVLMVEGFPGAIYPVHPRLKSLLGLKVYSTLEEIGHPVDLVISGLNAKLTTESVIEAARGSASKVSSVLPEASRRSAVKGYDMKRN